MRTRPGGALPAGGAGARPSRPPGLRPAPAHGAPPRVAPLTCPASTSALEELWARCFRNCLVERLCLDRFGMAVFAGPAKPLLALNPQDDAKFHKEVAQVRRRATKVSGCRGPTARRGGRRSLGSVWDRAQSCAGPFPGAPRPPGSPDLTSFEAETPPRKVYADREVMALAVLALGSFYGAQVDDAGREPVWGDGPLYLKLTLD